MTYAVFKKKKNMGRVSGLRLYNSRLMTYAVFKIKRQTILLSIIQSIQQYIENIQP